MAAVDTYRPAVARRAHYRCEYCRYPEAASSTPLTAEALVLNSHHALAARRLVIRLGLMGR